MKRLRRLINDGQGHRVAMSLAEMTLMIDAIRHPGIMRHVVRKRVGELVYELRRNEFDGAHDNSQESRS